VIVPLDGEAVLELLTWVSTSETTRPRES